MKNIGEDNGFYCGALFALAIMKANGCEVAAGDLINHLGGIGDLKRISDEGQDEDTLEWIGEQVHYSGKVYPEETL
jgi:hypothetical protein